MFASPRGCDGCGSCERVVQSAVRGPGYLDRFRPVAARPNEADDRRPLVAGALKVGDAILGTGSRHRRLSDAFALTYAEYWTGFERLFARADAIAIGVARAMANLRLRRRYRARHPPRDRAAVRLLAEQRGPARRRAGRSRATGSATVGHEKDARGAVS
jgi:hypothetical protein